MKNNVLVIDTGNFEKGSAKFDDVEVTIEDSCLVLRFNIYGQG